jgi:cellulose synthase/poly-beta-1,6-N-acetylglucosamine synthase-like glycosyltransferase
MESLFWVSLAVVAYVYVGYPALLAVWARVARRPVRRRTPRDAAEWPAVSVIIAARNEGARLPGRIANLLDQTYPGPLDIIVVSNGSHDGTAGALSQFADRVRLIELPDGGKPLALNAGVEIARGSILVFADARQRFSRDAILHLVENFADPAVGGVTGELILDCEQEQDDPADSTVADGVGLYWRYEKWLRRHESSIRSTLGATGAIYALRRELWQPLPAATLLDDVLAPMRAVLKGYRIVFDERARAFDRTAPDGSVESRRKVRTLAGNYQILAIEPRLLLPGTNPVWVQYLSHKIGRLLVPWALVCAFVASVALASNGWFYTLALALQVGFYALAAIGGWIEARDRQSPSRPIGRDDLPVVLGKEAR